VDHSNFSHVLPIALLKIFLYDRLGVSRRNGMEIENPGYWDHDGFAER
jgi:hypothetical protein